jgi:hypothetical protein
MIALTLALLLSLQEKSSDAEFLRRITLDLAGSIPTADQVRAFPRRRRSGEAQKRIDPAPRLARLRPPDGAGHHGDVPRAAQRREDPPTPSGPTT